MRYLYLPNQYSQQRQKDKPVWVYPVLMAMEATKRMQEGHDVDWNNGSGRYDKIISQPEGIDFLSLPIPDRVFTNAFDKRYQVYGNYKYTPATHIQVADGCFWGKCQFCVEKGKQYKVRPLPVVSQEIDQCHALGFRELFDDSGTFPTGKWLEDFCCRMTYKKYRMVLGCNMRIDADVDYDLMKAAGFRMLLYGIESANQKTLDRIGKGTYAKDIIPVIKRASDAGLEPHLAVMFGQPGESEAEELATVDLVQLLLKKGYAKTAQASIYKTPTFNGIDRGNKKKIYGAARSFEFWYHRIRGLKDIEDIRYLLKGIRKGLGL